MSNLRALIALELRSLYDINKMRYTKDTKAKVRYQRIGIAWVILIGMLCVYVGALAFGLCSLGMEEIVLTYLTVLASAFILLFGLFTAGNRIFGQKGYELLASLPVKPSAVVISRFVGLYVADLSLAAGIVIPGVAVYGYLIHPSAWFYVSAVITLLCIPIVPLVISVLFGSLVLGITSRMKGKSIAQSVLSVVLAVGIMLGSFGMDGLTSNLTSEQFAEMAQTIGATLGRVYPPAVWVNTLWGLLAFVLVSLAVFALVMWIAAKNFHAIMRRLKTVSAKHDYRIGAMHSRGIVKTLYFREMKRYFASSIYVTNTVIGPILGTLLAAALLFSGTDVIKEVLPIAGDVTGLIPFVYAAVAGMMSTTSVSVSMEGTQLRTIKSLPIPVKPWLDSKILWQLSLQAPFYVAAEVLLAIALRPTAWDLVWLIAIPASLIVFAAVFGITVNLRFHSFDWEYEAAVVKQSLPAALGGFTPAILGFVLAGAMLLVPPAYTMVAKAGICVLLWAVTALLYYRNNRKTMEMIE